MIEDTTTILDRIGEMERSLAELKASLAEQWESESVPPGSFDVFVCRARDERYGLFVDAVEEVIPMCELADYPQGPPWLSGMLNLRRRMIPVVDVQARVARGHREVDVDDFIVIARVGEKRFGLVFQEVFRVSTVNGSGVQPPMRDVPEAPYVLGIAEFEKRPMYLLSLACLLGTSEIPEVLP